MHRTYTVELVFPKNLEAAIFRNTPTDIFPHYKSGLYAPSKVRVVPILYISGACTVRVRW
jgi:hypothetical protein